MRPNRSRDLTSLFKPMNSNVPSTIKRVDLVGTDASITMVLGSLQTGLMHKICKLLRSNGDRKNANAAAKAKEMRKLAREKWRKLAGFTDESVAVPAAVQEERHVVVPAKVEAPAPTPEKFKLPYITSEAARACSLLLLQVLQLEELGLSISEVETLTRGSNDEAKMHRGVRRSIALATALARGVVCNEPPSTRPEVLVAAVLICLESHFAPLVDGPENVAKTISFFGRTQEAHTSEAIRTELERVLANVEHADARVTLARLAKLTSRVGVENVRDHGKFLELTTRCVLRTSRFAWKHTKGEKVAASALLMALYVHDELLNEAVAQEHSASTETVKSVPERVPIEIPSSPSASIAAAALATMELLSDIGLGASEEMRTMELEVKEDRVDYESQHKHSDMCSTLDGEVNKAGNREEEVRECAKSGIMQRYKNLPQISGKGVGAMRPLTPKRMKKDASTMAHFEQERSRSREDVISSLVARTAQRTARYERLRATFCEWRLRIALAKVKSCKQTVEASSTPSTSTKSTNTMTESIQEEVSPVPTHQHHHQYHQLQQKYSSLQDVLEKTIEELDLSMGARDELSVALMKKDKEIARLKVQLKTLVGGLVVGETPLRANAGREDEPSTPVSGTEKVDNKVVVLEWDRDKHGSPPPPPTPTSPSSSAAPLSSSSSSSSEKGPAVVFAEWDKEKHGSPPPPPTPPRAMRDDCQEQDSATDENVKPKSSSLGTKKTKTKSKTPRKKSMGKKQKKHRSARKPRTPLLQLSTSNT